MDGIQRENMKLVKLPTHIALAEEIERSEDLGTDIVWAEGSVLVNIDEIQEVVEGTSGKDCSIFYKSGDSTKIELTIDEIYDYLVAPLKK